MRSSPDNHRVGWFFYVLLALAIWWAYPNAIAVLCVMAFFGVWFWNADRMHRTDEQSIADEKAMKEREAAVKQATKEIETFDPVLLDLEKQRMDAIWNNASDEDIERLQNARRHRIQVLLNERGLVK